MTSGHLLLHAQINKINKNYVLVSAELNRMARVACYIGYANTSALLQSMMTHLSLSLVAIVILILLLFLAYIQPKTFATTVSPESL